MEDELARVVFSDPPYNLPVGGRVCGLRQVFRRDRADRCGAQRGDQRAIHDRHGKAARRLAQQHERTILRQPGRDVAGEVAVPLHRGEAGAAEQAALGTEAGAVPRGDGQRRAHHARAARGFEEAGLDGVVHLRRGDPACLDIGRREMQQAAAHRHSASFVS
jgi:hypothetical protein